MRAHTHYIVHTLHRAHILHTTPWTTLLRSDTLSSILDGQWGTNGASQYRDAFNMHKYILVAVRSGKVMALDTESSEVLWSRQPEAGLNQILEPKLYTLR